MNRRTNCRVGDVRRVVGAWTTNGNVRTYSYVAYERNVDRDRVTVRTAREGEAVISFISFGEPYAGTYAALYARQVAAVDCFLAQGVRGEYWEMIRDGKLSRLELHARSAVPGRKVKVVLPPSLGASPVEIEPICP